MGHVDATIFVERPPEIEFHDGLFFVTYRAGDAVMRFCMSPHTYQGAIRNSDTARKGFARVCGVVPIKALVRDH